MSRFKWLDFNRLTEVSVLHQSAAITLAENTWPNDSTTPVTKLFYHGTMQNWASTEHDAADNIPIKRPDNSYCKAGRQANAWLHDWDTGRDVDRVTRSSATAKSTARPSYLVGVLYDIYRETNNRSTANQPLVRNWPWNLLNSAK